jgi:muramoyltetrapeptide carboxypeptidase
MSEIVKVGIFAASSIGPEIEFGRGIEHLKQNGFDPVIQPQVRQHAFILPGTDEARAESIYQLAMDPTIEVLWAARGGYGAGRLLPILDKLTAARGKPPKKLLVGYSDVTVLHEYVRSRWGWSTLHAPMPAASNFSSLHPKESQSIVDYVKHRPADAPWALTPLTWMTDPPKSPIDAELVGGNLSLWAALVGTPYLSSGRNRIIFLEDTDEAFYRIDRMMVQLVQSGALHGAAALILGDFTDCHDENNTCLAAPQGDIRKPLRQVFTQEEAFDEIFTKPARAMGLPLATGLGVGHGPHYAPLPLGARYQLTPTGTLKLLQWDWLPQSLT